MDATSTPDHIQAVITAHAAVATAREQLATATDARADALRAAHDTGLTWRELGAALSLTGQQVELASLPRADRAARRRPRDTGTRDK